MKDNATRLREIEKELAEFPYKDAYRDDALWLCAEVKRLVEALHEATKDGDGQCFYCDAATVMDHRGDCPLAGWEHADGE
jgi:hypothetical protein